MYLIGQCRAPVTTALRIRIPAFVCYAGYVGSTSTSLLESADPCPHGRGPERDLFDVVFLPSSMLDGQTQLLAAFAVVVLAVLHYVQRKARLLPPPGPPCRPVLGLNPKRLPRTEPWKVYADWGKKYGALYTLPIGREFLTILPGPISSFHVLGRRVIILNGFEAASELLNKRASIYSERPSRVFYDIVMGRGTSVFNIAASDDRHKTYRRVLHGSLNVRAIHAYRSMQEEECKAFLKRLAVSPEDFANHVRRYVESLTQSAWTDACPKKRHLVGYAYHIWLRDAG